MTSFTYSPTFKNTSDSTEYRLLSTDYINHHDAAEKSILQIDPAGLRFLAGEAFKEAAFFLRKDHLQQLTNVLHDPDASANDQYVASTLIRNAVEAGEGILPMCQDTGTAIIAAYKGELVHTGCDDKEHLSHGIFDTFTKENLRYSQMAPLSMFEEVNTATNLPAQIDIYATQGDEYHFLFIAKGGGSANKTFLYQETKSLLNEESLTDFLKEKIPTLGTAACPPYHIAVVIGGSSAETNLKTAKLASTHYYDNLPTTGNEDGRAFRDLDWEERVMEISRQTGIGAQFGGKYLCHDARVIRLPRHAASNPVSIAVSCSADRNIKGKITRDGIFLEKLEKNPVHYQEAFSSPGVEPVAVDLDQPMPEILKLLSQHPVGTLLHLSGSMIVARDIAHAKVSQLLKGGQSMPDYFKNHPVYYAGPAKTPEGMVSGSFGPTTAGRMDVYVDEFQRAGGSMVMIAKGNRSKDVTKACHQHGGFYLGSIGGPAATLAKECIESVEVIDFPELGMEAVRKILVRDFPAFIVCDDKGNDLFEQF